MEKDYLYHMAKKGYFYFFCSNLCVTSLFPLLFRKLVLGIFKSACAVGSVRLTLGKQINCTKYRAIVFNTNMFEKGMPKRLFVYIVNEPVTSLLICFKKDIE